MKGKLIAGAVALLMLGMALPAIAYHVNSNGLTPPNNPADWSMAIPFLIICESNGPTDDRNSNPAGAISGNGGLCTTGENDATGLPCFNTVASGGRCTEPPSGEYVRLDVCSSLTATRGAGMPCAPTGSTAQHSYDAEVGAYICFVPTVAPTTTPTSIDHAFYYSRLYAWWSYDGDGSYTLGDVAGAGPTEDGDSLDNRAAVPGQVDNEDYWHGHATVFISMGDSIVGASTSGSVETTLIPAATVDAWRATMGAGMGPLNDGFDSPAMGTGTDVGPGGVTTDCNGSPSNAPSGSGTPLPVGNVAPPGVAHTGPVFRAPNCDNTLLC
jgi:hypothetical protein